MTKHTVLLIVLLVISACSSIDKKHIESAQLNTSIEFAKNHGLNSPIRKNEITAMACMKNIRSSWNCHQGTYKTSFFDINKDVEFYSSIKGHFSIYHDPKNNLIGFQFNRGNDPEINDCKQSIDFSLERNSLLDGNCCYEYKKYNAIEARLSEE